MALTLLACFLIVATDIGSYMIGRRFGHHPLSPISPGKTIEGALGVACSVPWGLAASAASCWAGGSAG
jgi:phosphatidate cytidylyltransferase